MKVYVKLTKKDKEGKDVEDLERFFNLTKDATRKFYTYIQDPEVEDLGFFRVKAVAITRAVTVIGEGILDPNDFLIGGTLNVFENQGFAYVDKIVED